MKFTYPLITFTTSFATMSYAMIIASILSDFSGEEIISQCLTLGPYLLGLGLGSYLGDRVVPENYLKRIWTLEWLSATLLPLIPLFILVLIFFYNHFSDISSSIESKPGLWFLMSWGGSLAFLAGALGGAQLPLIIKKATNLKNETILAVSYLGPLFAGPFIVMTAEKLNVSGQVVIVGLVQIIGLILIIGLKKRRKLLLGGLILPVALLVAERQIYPSLEYHTIKSSYMGIKLQKRDLWNFSSVFNIIASYGDLQRIRTPFQVIDFFLEPAQSEILWPSNATLYLNRKPQFDLFSIKVYHESMVYGGLNILGRMPKKVLILGGGDGLLLKELLPIKEIEQITMVELDQAVISWAKTNPIIHELNQGALEEKSNRVKIVTEDAISFLRKNDGKEKFDFILIDFPFPEGHELSKLYSKEFYHLVNKTINSNGVISIDLPIQMEADNSLAKEGKIILKTLKVSGFENMLIYGPYASFLVLRADGKDCHFQYETLPEHLHLSSKINLVEIFDENSLTPEEWSKVEINSMFRPGPL